MGILQMIVLAILLLVAVTAGNIIAYRMIQRSEERKTEKDIMTMMLQSMAPTTTE